MKSYDVVVIPGDGIGPELTRAAVEVLHAVARGGKFELALDHHEAGASLYRRAGRVMTDETLAACRAAHGVLKGPVGDPAVRAPDGTEAGVLGGVLRPGLDAYANVRPIRLYPGVTSALAGRAPGSIDYVVVRENTEGLYASRGRGFVTEDVCLDTMVITRRGVERIARKALAIARQRAGAPADGRRRLTCVDKANVLRSFAFFRDGVRRVAAEFPDVEVEYLYADAAAARLVQDPGHFDLLVMENFLGDILSDLGGGTIGGLGMCPSGNIGDRAAYFEPIHGSAPDLAGTDRANPLSMVLSGAMMLDWLGETDAARRVREAVDGALRDAAISLRPDGTVAQGTRAAGHAVAERLERDGSSAARRAWLLRPAPRGRRGRCRGYSRWPVDSFRSYRGYPCGAVCRASQTLRVLTDGALIAGVDKLLKSLDAATVSLARGDGQVEAKMKVQAYEKAKAALQKYIDDLQQLSAKGQVPATVFPDLLGAATELIADIDDLIGAV